MVTSFNGTTGNDTITGSAGDDVIKGLNGLDILDGGLGNDDISGDEGDDTMLGGAGIDTLRWIDGDGSDLIMGGEGRDTVIFTGATQSGRPNRSAGDEITLTRDPAGDDLLLRRTSPGPITLRIDEVEIIDINGVEGDDRVTVGSLIGTTVGRIEFSGGLGNDFFDARDDGRAVMNIQGDAGDDILLAGNQEDTLEGGSGNDILFGNNGNDVLIGVDTGNLVNPGRGEIDSLTGGAVRDRFVLGDRASGRVRVFYNDGNISSSGDGDRAQIIDFQSGLDVIQLVGTQSDYVLRTVSGSLGGGGVTQDMGIYRKGTALFESPELIAVVQDVGVGLNLTNTSQFVFV